MFPELSLHVLDIAENSVRAGASDIGISVTADEDLDLMEIVITDDGCGMSADEIARVADPFYTTRDTRPVGLGIPFLKQACECTGGSLSVDSGRGKGTRVRASLVLTSIDRMPLGDMASTMHALITAHEDIRFVYAFAVRKQGADEEKMHFTLDTGKMREVLGADISFQTPEVSQYIKAFVADNTREVMEAAGITNL